VLASADNDAIFYNPGLLDAARGLGASVAFYGRAALFTMSAAAEWWRGGVGLGLQSLSWGAPSAESGAFTRGEAGLAEGGSVSATEHVVSGAYARLVKGFRVGIGAKLIEQRRGGERDVTAAADVGIARRIRSLTLGFAAQNLGRQPELADADLALPIAFTVGAANQTAPLGPLDVVAAASVSRWRDNRLSASAGIEIGYWPVSGRTFIARIGFRWIEDSDARPLTLGAGFTGDRIVIDYAIQDFEDGEPVHRIGLRWR
jgi:hypothetical protein